MFLSLLWLHNKILIGTEWCLSDGRVTLALTGDAPQKVQQSIPESQRCLLYLVWGQELVLITAALESHSINQDPQYYRILSKSVAFQ